MIKLNCDAGESFGSWKMGLDEAIMPYVDMANFACGFHAGDPVIMDRSIKLALKHGVTIGAHPAYPDLVGFGRTIHNHRISCVKSTSKICHINIRHNGFIKSHFPRTKTLACITVQFDHHLLLDGRNF
jgi:hypothetical protein